MLTGRRPRHALVRVLRHCGGLLAHDVENDTAEARANNGRSGSCCGDVLTGRDQGVAMVANEPFKRRIGLEDVCAFSAAPLTPRLPFARTFFVR